VALGFPALMLVIMFAVALPAYNQYLQTMQSQQSYQFDDSDNEYPSEYSDENSVDQSLYSDEAVEDGIPQDDGYPSENENESESDADDAETPQ
jgi:hypothetical protein